MLRHTINPSDIIGTSSGKVMIIEYLGSKRDTGDRVRHYYKAQCEECGKIFAVRRDNFLSGHSTTCGCVRTRQIEGWDA